MLADAVDRNDEPLDLSESLARAARRATDTQVAWYVISGAASSLTALAFRPFGWPVFGAIGLCIAAFGAWGLADRELRERQEPGRLATASLLALRAIAAVAGMAGAAVVLFILLGIALGTLQS